MKRSLILFCVACLSVLKTFADEGMWLPQLLAALNEKEMKKMGMKISAADIYSISKGSLKDAIVSFGGFCTAEVISDQGLLLTNHHCGFDAVQNHSSLQHNYIREGFWAYDKKDELTNPGLFATFIISITEVSNVVLKDVTVSMTERERQSTIDKNIAAFKKSVSKEAYQDLLIRPFFEGNQYFMFVTETYRDIRLVGAPPASIGNFGKDTDNWMWPRHTGDFSMFRIYAGRDNKPAEFAAGNVPYKPKRSLNISMDGVKEGDFTMVLGFPGRTTEYLHSSALNQIMTVSNPAKIAIREKALQVMDGFMRSNEQVKIQYAAKYAGIENAYKKWKGEIIGLQSFNAVGRKKQMEDSFTLLLLKKPDKGVAYAGLLDKLQSVYQSIAPYALARDYYNEIIPKVELFALAANANAAITAFQKDPAGFNNALAAINSKLDNTFGEYNAEVDQHLFEVLIELYVQQPQEYVSPLLKKMLAENGYSFEALAASVYGKTTFTDNARLKALLAGIPTDTVEGVANDVAAALYTDIVKTYAAAVSPKLNEQQALLNQLQRNYMQAQIELFNAKSFYPDANGTLRVTYGNVKGYKARDAVNYSFYTYLDGVLEKYKPGDYEFDVPEKLIDLYNKKDFGPYALDGRLPVCFIAANHTTGGNSGSPALDANGNLVGLNFDRVWEGTMSDINYNKEICRNIMVDIRYVLFIVDKFAGAKNIIAELKLVKKQ